MAKKLIEIQKQVETSGALFYNYLKETLDSETFDALDNISKQTGVIIFSGVIRNFFLKKKDFRDIDVVLKDEISIDHFFPKSYIKKNSFGGYKIHTEHTKVDLWYLENTWAIKRYRPIDLDLAEYVPYTAFFNFSAVTYSYNERKFSFTKDFLRFIQNRRIDFVYKPNANNSLCIVNTFYYQEKYKLRIADRLKRYVIELHKSGNRNYKSVQQKHFGEVLFSDTDIEDRIASLIASLESKKRRVNNSPTSTFFI